MATAGYNITFVSGTRAEFGLMIPALRAIQRHPSLNLQLILTGMHLDKSRGNSLQTIGDDGWKIDAIAPWPVAKTPAQSAASTGAAVAKLARLYPQLKSNLVLVVGDRVEAFAAAAAAHISRLPVAHVHGGDRAQGQVDDALRHAITKLAHVHLAATADSAVRIKRLGETAESIHVVGSPGLDDLKGQTASWKTVGTLYPQLRPKRYAILLLHPTAPDDELEYQRAALLLDAARAQHLEQLVLILPNTDPGAAGIARRWNQQRDDCLVIANLSRPIFLGLLKNAAFLAGNSSAGIIEAGSFATPVLDVGPRQRGRVHGTNVHHCGHSAGAIRRAMTDLSLQRRPIQNPWAGPGAGRRIAQILADYCRKSSGPPEKLISY